MRSSFCLVVVYRVAKTVLCSGRTSSGGGFAQRREVLWHIYGPARIQTELERGVSARPARSRVAKFWVLMSLVVVGEGDVCDIALVVW